MATKITTALDDDLDGGPADETVRFAAGGTEYEIDLTNKHAAACRKQRSPHPEHTRKSGRGQRRPPTTSGPAAKRRHPGPGRKSRASRSAAAGAPPPVS